MTDPATRQIFTRTGDDGTTGLRSGRRVAKSEHRIECVGEVDELISAIGLARTLPDPEAGGADAQLFEVQVELMELAARLAADGGPPDLDTAASAPQAGFDARTTRLEAEIARMTRQLPPLTAFVVPGGTSRAAVLHQCRTICRRMERRLVGLHELQPLPGPILRYVNRLSDWFFTLARQANHRSGVAESCWLPGRAHDR